MPDRDRLIREREQGHLSDLFLPKRAFSTKAAAKKSRTAPGLRGAGGLTPYRCFVCRQWHVGHGPGRGSV